ncbi:MAG: hypothetical protein ACRDNH_13450 [Gaiellaceae bacterium]
MSEDREMNQPRQSDEEDDVEAHSAHPSTQPAAPEAAATEEGPDVEGHIHTPASVQPNVEP